MLKLYIDDNYINDLDNCDYLTITTIDICTSKNINLNLDKFTNLQYLDLTNNQITEIKGLDNLVNLKELYLPYNRITEIKELENLAKLRKLYLRSNQITEIKRLNNLLNLQTLYLGYNQITEIKGLENLVNLQKIFFHNGGGDFLFFKCFFINHLKSTYIFFYD